MQFDAEQPSFRALEQTLAERTSPVIAWLGAGMSAPIAPTWLQLLQNLERVLAAKNAGMQGNSMRSGLAGVIAAKRKEGDYWLCFELLLQQLGATTYESEIRAALSNSENTDPPEKYRLLWNLPIGGAINLNLDPLAQRAYTQVHAGRSLDIYDGSEIINLISDIRAGRHFVAHLHGRLQNSRNWVFTKPQLDSLQARTEYELILSTLLLTRTLLFVGISADDIAISRHLRRLEALGIRSGPHYWITDRTDERTDTWAEQLGIRIIRYPSSGADHSALDQCLTLLRRSRPYEKRIEQPVLLGREPENEACSTKDLSLLTTDELRSHLNELAGRLFSPADPDQYERFEKFARQYDEEIHRAWFVTVNPPKNYVFGYRIISKIAKGAFGDVYQAESPNQDLVAIKVLREELRTDDAMLQTYRRGIRSMEILTQNKVAGIVRLLAATEIPAVAVMEWIDGPDLSDAIKNRYIEGWPGLLRIAAQLGRIVLSAHRTPENVLHRDLRPTNVMLRGFWAEPESAEVVVLDFDLSWHVSALEKSIMAKPLGYLAPEQLRTDSRFGRRSALVDTYGFGMTLFFLLTGIDPVPEIQDHGNWADILKQKVCTKRHPSWVSLPTRVARLIFKCTLTDQSRRPDFAYVAEQVHSLWQASESNFDLLPLDAIVEELAARSAYLDGYIWSTDLLTAERVSSSGSSCTLATDLARRSADLTIQWSQTGMEERRHVVPVEKVKAALALGGWGEVTHEVAIGVVKFRTSIDLSSWSQLDITRVSRSVDKAIELIQPRG